MGADQEIEAETLQPHWQVHDSGVQVLPSALSLSEAGETLATMVQPLAAYLRQTFPVAFLDLPPMLSGTTAAALAAARGIADRREGQTRVKSLQRYHADIA